MRVPRTNLTVLVLAAFLAAACSAPDDEATVLRRGNGGDPGSLDPALAQDEHAFNVLADLYEGLVIHGPDGSIRPGAATRWEISEDGLTYTFHLRPDALWSNGLPVTAAHFVHAFDRVADPATAAPLSFLLDPIKSAEAVDDLTLAVTLNSPTPHMLSVLAMSIALPSWPGGEVGAVTNGPFVLDYWRPGELLRVVRNPNYHSAESIGIDAVEFYPIADPATELTRYRAGELDLTATVPPASLSRLREERPEELHIAPRLAVYYLALDTTEPPFDDPAIREALSQAIDRQALVEVLGRGEQPALGFVPDGLEGYEPARYDWQDGAAVLDEPLSITYLYDTGDVHETIALAVASMWRDKLGIDVQIEKREWKYFLASRDERDQWDVMRFAWTGDYAHPSTFLDLFLSGSEMNLPAWSNAEFDRRMSSGAYAEAEAMMLAEYPVIPLYFYVSKHLVSPAVAGFVNNPLDLHPSRFLSLH